MGRKRTYQEEKLNTLSAIDTPKRSFIIMKSFTTKNYNTGDDVKRFLSKSRVLTYSDDEEADKALDKFYETGLRKKQFKKKNFHRSSVQIYSKIVYYSDDETDEQVRKLFNDSSDSDSDCCDVFGRKKKRKH